MILTWAAQRAELEAELGELPEETWEALRKHTAPPRHLARCNAALDAAGAGLFGDDSASIAIGRLLGREEEVTCWGDVGHLLGVSRGADFTQLAVQLRQRLGQIVLARCARDTRPGWAGALGSGRRRSPDADAWDEALHHAARQIEQVLHMQISRGLPPLDGCGSIPMTTDVVAAAGSDPEWRDAAIAYLSKNLALWIGTTDRDFVRQLAEEIRSLESDAVA